MRRPACAAAVLAAAIVVVSAAASPVGAAGSARAGSSRIAAPTLTESQLAADLAAGAQTEQVPANLKPALGVASSAMPIIDRDGCNVPRYGVRSKGCVFADRTSHTTVVLFGDSHAGVWFPALDQISRQQHWRLVDLTKDGCPPAEVAIAARFYNGGPYWECSAWRANAKAQIARLHPTLVVMSEARYLEVAETTPTPGATQQSTWLAGLGSILAFLRQKAKHVVFMSDAPTMTQPAPACVSAHRSDVQFCATSLSAAIQLPDVKAGEIALAARERVTAIDPTPWFCTPTTCPVIVHHILLYRDIAHMVPDWSSFLAPILAESIVPIVRPDDRHG